MHEVILVNHQLVRGLQLRVITRQFICSNLTSLL